MRHKRLSIIRALLAILISVASSKASYAVGININSGITLDINSIITLKIEGDINNKGTLRTDNGTITLNGDWLKSGLFSPGAGAVEFNSNDLTDNQIFDVNASDSFFSLIHSGAGILTPNTETTAIDINGSFINSAGTFITQGRNMNVAGNWSNSGGFLHQNNTVVLDGADQSLMGNTTFYNLDKTIKIVGTQTLTFDNTAKQTVNNNLTLKGVATNLLLSLRSDSTGQQFDIALSAGGLQLLEFLDVKDSNASGGLLLIGTSSVDSGNNTNWSFGGGSSPTPTPTSTLTSTPTPTSTLTPTPTPTSAPIPISTPTPTSISTPIPISTPTPTSTSTPTPMPTATPTPLPGADIKGNVVDSRFIPVSGMFVDAFDFFNGTWQGSGLTNRKGDYTISNIHAGSYKVGVDVSGTPFVGQFFENADFITASKITLTESVDVTRVNFILSEANFIRGRVLDDSDKPVIGATVDAFDAKTGDWVNSGLTDGKGEYSITLSPGKYKVAVDTFGTRFLSEFFLDARTFEDALVVEVTSKSNAENINFALSAGGEIKGRVTDVSDNSIQGIIVNVFDAATGKLLNSSVTDKEGNYSIPVAPGRYNVSVEIAGTNFKPGLRENVVVKSGSASPVVDFEMFIADSIKGSVTDNRGDPRPNMFVKVINAKTEEFVNFNVSDSGGKYSIPVLPGSYKVIIDTTGTDVLPISKDVTITDSDVVVDFTLAFAGLIRGNVIDSSNNPISGLTVNAFDFDSGIWVAFDKSDKNGDYAIPVPPGSYKVGADTLDTTFAPLIFDNTDWDRAKAVNVSEGKDALDIDFILSVDTSIVGKITDGINPLKEIFVDVFDFDTGTWINSGKTNELGTYTVSLQGGVYRVGTFAAEQGFADEFFDNADFDLAKRVKVLPGETKSGIDFALTSGGSISGLVSSGSTPIAGIEINALEFETNRWINKNISNSNGGYKISGLPAGKYRIWAFDTDETRSSGRFVSGFFGNTRSWNQASFVITANGQDVPNINIDLSRGGAVSGNVMDKDSKGIGAAVVEAYEVKTGEWSNSVRTNSSGGYTIALPSDVEYIVRAFDPSGSSTANYFKDVFNWHEASTIKLNTGENRTNINFSLSDKGNFISGAVINDKNRPLKGIEVNLFDFDSGAWIDSATTDSKGRYSIRVRSGKYRIGVLPVDAGVMTAFYNNVSRWNSSVPVFVSDLQGTGGINFRLLKGGVINGTVSDESDVQLSGVNVQVFDFDTGSWINEDVTDANGIYRIAVPPGKYRVRAIPLDAAKRFSSEFHDNMARWDLAAPVTIESKETTKLIRFNLAKGNHITGSVVNGGGIPQAGVRIDVFDFDTGFWIDSAVTDKDGKYTTNGLSNGNYRVKASPRLETRLAGSFFRDADNWNGAKRVVINSEVANDINFTLFNGGLVTGRITDVSSDMPIPGIEVGAYNIDTGNPFNGDWINSGITDGNGNYSIKVPFGIYLVRANASGTNYIGTFYDNVFNTEQAKSAAVTFGRDFNANFSLATGGRFKGTVSNIDNSGIKGARVDIFDFNTNVWVNNGLTDINGEYNVNVPSGVYRIKITAPVGSDFIDEDLKAPVKIAAPNEIRIAGVVLSEGRGLVIGVARDSKGLRLEGIKVDAFDFDTGEPVGFGITDSNGNYSLSLPPGQFRVKTSSRGSGKVFADKFFNNAVVWGDASAVNVSKDIIRTADFVLDKAACVSGIVRNAKDLTPLAGIEVHIFQSDTAVWFNSDKTDSNGSYSVCVPDGVYRIWAADKRADFKPQFFNITESFDNAKRIVVSGSDISGVNFELLAK